MGHYDAALAQESVSGPGADTRHWCSYGTVDPDTPDARSVDFTTKYGPLVHVTLHPSGIPVICRVAHHVAGNGEGEWFPFVGGDEVLVLIPEGDETAGCAIVGRLNQEIDQWPQQVAGQDSTKNNFAFRRLRTPYVMETGAGYLVRSATTKAFLSLSPIGDVVLSNADSAFLALNAHFCGLQNADADTLIQLDVENKRVVLEAAGTKQVLDASQSSLYTSGTMEIGTAGNQAAEHATSAEAMVNLLATFLLAAAGAATTPVSLVGFFAAFAAPGPLAALIELAAGRPLTPDLTAAIQQALQTPKVAGSIVGIGAGGLLIG